MHSTDIERFFVSSLIHHPVEIPAVAAVVSPADLYEACTRTVFRRAVTMHAGAQDIQLISLVEELKTNGEIDACGGVPAVVELYDEADGRSFNPDLTKRIRKRALADQLRRIYQQLAAGDDEAGLRERAALVETEFARVDAPDIGLELLGFSGERLQASREREMPDSPLPEIFDCFPSLHLCQGRPKVGKTTLALYLAQCWACGVQPWQGTEPLPQGRALILSAEQPLMRVDSTLRRMDIIRPEVARDVWTDQITIIARDRGLSREARSMLVLDGPGQIALREGLARARDAGDPYRIIVMDSLSRLKPPSVEENDNDGMSKWLGELEEIAEDFEVYILLVHHVGHSGRTDAVTAGRGASSIAAVAQAAWLLSKSSDDPRCRSLKVEGNEILERTITLQVAFEQDDEGAISCFRRVDALSRYKPTDFLEPGEEINASELAKRISGKAGRDEPNGHDRALAKSLRVRWAEAKWIHTWQGPRNAIMMSLTPSQDAEEEGEF